MSHQTGKICRDLCDVKKFLFSYMNALKNEFMYRFWLIIELYFQMWQYL